MTPAYRPVVMGVAGGSGSGKSTVVSEVCHALPPGTTAVLHHDAYYRDLSHLAFEERVQVNFDHPESLETELMVEHVARLLARAAAEVPTYDFSTHTRASAVVRVEPRPLVILDGILVLADARLRELMDVRVFVDTDADVRLMRRLRRDVEERGRTAASVLDQYEATVRPMHLEFVEPSKRHADFVVPEGGYNRVAVDLLVTKLRDLIAARRSPEDAIVPAVRQGAGLD